MKLLWFNLATDADDPVLGFGTRWIEAVAERVDRIHVVTMRRGRVDAPANVTVRSVGRERGHGEPRRALRFYRHLFGILRDDDVDACFSHMIPIFSVMAAPVLRPRGIPIVTWYAHRHLSTKLKLAHHASRAVVSVNAESYPYRKDRFIALGHGIDTERFRPGARSPDQPPLLLSVGRFSPVKRVDVLIDAVALLRRRGTDVRCALVGGVTDRHPGHDDVLRGRIRRHALEDRVTLVPPVPNARVVDWYGRSFAHVNLTMGPDKAALEAMACGRPSLVANPGFADTLGPWARSLLLPEASAEAVADGVEAVLALAPDERLAMGDALRRGVVDRHGLDRLADRLVELLRPA